MLAFLDRGLRRQKSATKLVRARYDDLVERSDFTELKRLFADIWGEHPEEQEFRTKLSLAGELLELSEGRLKLARAELPSFDDGLDVAEGALNDCQRYIENLLATLMTRQMSLKSQQE